MCVCACVYMYRHTYICIDSIFKIITHEVKIIYFWIFWTKIEIIAFSERNSAHLFVCIFYINKILIQPLKLYPLERSNSIHCSWILIFP